MPLDCSSGLFASIATWSASLLCLSVSFQRKSMMCSAVSAPFSAISLHRCALASSQCPRLVTPRSALAHPFTDLRSLNYAILFPFIAHATPLVSPLFHRVSVQFPCCAMPSRCFPLLILCRCVVVPCKAFATPRLSVSLRCNSATDPSFSLAYSAVSPRFSHVNFPLPLFLQQPRPLSRP